MQLDCRSASSLQEARHWLARDSFQLCLTDMRLPDGTGLELVRLLQQQPQPLPVAMITAHGDLDTAIDALKTGAFDFLTKPVDLPRLRELVKHALELAQPQDDPPRPVHKQRLLGQSPAMQQLRRQILQLARSQAPVYISGESGSGKEQVARQIHEQGPRARGPFIAINCGAIPAELMESELFGHCKGSFTGATEDRAGLIRTADGGTLFLDEVADLPLAMQVKLLRVIQEKTVRPVGGTREIPADIRLLCATHRDLAAEVATGRFRQDLYYRLNVIELPVPPLRQHREDIPELASSILQRLARDSASPPAALQPDAMQALLDYPFPGNVRELENILERACALREDNSIGRADLRLATPARSSPESPALADVCDLEAHLEGIERSLIVQALEENRWNRTAAARRLGLSFRSLRYRLKKLGLDTYPPSYRRHHSEIR